MSDFERADVVCPYCLEKVEVFFEADVRGRLVIDCEVCCNPWDVTVERAGLGDVRIRVDRLQD